MSETFVRKPGTSPYDEPTAGLRLPSPNQVRSWSPPPANGEPRRNASNGQRHEYANDDVFLDAEAFFTPGSASEIPFFDKKIAAHMYLSGREWTQSELATCSEDIIPGIADLRAAREHLDAQHKPSLKRMFTVRWKKLREENDQYHTANKRFTMMKDAAAAYIAPTAEDLQSPLAQLTIARAHYAEASARARSDVGNNGSAEWLQLTAEAYGRAFEAYSTSTIEETTRRNHTWVSHPERRAQFVASFYDHENGALMGEEAQAYITAASDKNLLHRTVDKYNTLNTPAKIITGAAIAAIAGIALGPIGGGAALGGMVGVRFGRNWVSREASRRGVSKTQQEVQQASVSYSGKSFDLRQHRHAMLQAPSITDDTVSEIYKANLMVHDVQTREDMRRIKKSKRRALGGAALLTVVPVIGGALGGTFVEYAVERVGRYFSGTQGHRGGTFKQPSLPPHPDPTPETLPPTISPESSYLYGNFAGQPMTITLSQPGSSIWSEVAKHVPDSLPYSEHERLTANIVDEILRQNPGINPTELPVGWSYHLQIPR